jgi:hypothetical protein
MIEADAQFSIVPGIYNSYKVGDIVFIGFEESKMELPVILGKLFVSASAEAGSYRGNLSGNSLSITDTAQLPYSTLFNFDKIAQNDKLYKALNTPKKLADSIIALQQAPAHKYQTVIKVLVSSTGESQIDKKEYNLYLKTSNDFTYSSNTSDEPLNKLCTALKNSQTTNIFIPLELAIDKDGTVSPALLQIHSSTSADMQLTVLIGETAYTISKSDIIEIQSSIIYY